RVQADVQPQLVPDDQYYAQYNCHLQNTVGGIRAPSAWDQSTGEGIVVAVLDTGIALHPDMYANMLQGYDVITDPFVSRRPTHVSGTVAELTNNGIGMAGVAHDAQVLPVRVLGRCGGYTSDIVDAVVWAAGDEVPDVPMNENPAEVINLSLGGFGACAAIEQD